MPGFIIPHNYDSKCQKPAGSGFGPSNVTETARAHRYLLEVLEPLGSLNDSLLLYLEKCNRPSVEFDKIMIHSGQDEISRPGKVHYKDIEFTFYEKLNNEGDQCAKLIYGWWSDTMMDIETGFFRPPSTYLKQAQLEMLDGGGSPIWTYMIYDCWPLKVTPSDLDYSNTDIARVGVTLAYARAKERKLAGGD